MDVVAATIALQGHRMFPMQQEQSKQPQPQPQLQPAVGAAPAYKLQQQQQSPTPHSTAPQLAVEQQLSQQPETGSFPLQFGSLPVTPPQQLRHAHSLPTYPEAAGLDMGLGPAWHPGLQDADMQLAAMSSLLGMEDLQPQDSKLMMGGAMPFGQPMQAQPWDSPATSSGLQPTWGSGHSSLTTQQGFSPGAPLSRYDSLPELSSLASLSSLPRALPAELQMAPAAADLAQPDFAVVYAFLGSLFDDSTSSMDHARMLEQDLPPQDRRTVHMLLGNLNAALQDPAFAAVYAKAAKHEQPSTFQDPGAHNTRAAQPDAPVSAP